MRRRAREWFWVIAITGIALPGCALFAPQGVWTGTATFLEVSGATDPTCRPNWGENPGDTKAALLSFMDVRSTGAVHLAVPKDFEAAWYQLSMLPFAHQISLKKILSQARGSTADPERCDLMLEEEVVTGVLENDRFDAVMTQRWHNTRVDDERVIVRYSFDLQKVFRGDATQMPGVWKGTPRLETVESENKCIAQAHQRWGHQENQTLMWIRGEPPSLRADVLDFSAQDDCQYTGRVSENGEFTLTSGNGSCGGGTGVDECGPSSGFQLRSKTIDGALSNGRLTGRMVETWSLHAAPYTPIVVTYRFSFDRVGDR